jgi:hypothetical protein
MRFRRVILWILLALLPLRGWATSDMQVSMGMSTVMAATAAAASTQAAPDVQHHAAAPCHGVAAKEDVDAAPELSTVGHTACTLCDLCHSVAMATAAPVLSALPMVAKPSFSLVSTDTGHLLIARLDRPPRFVLPV